jgi:hypothetical protein
MPDENVDDVSTTLFSSVHLGLPSGAGELNPRDLLATIDDELNDAETSSQSSSWETLPDRPRARPAAGAGAASGSTPSTRRRRLRLKRSSGPAMEFNVRGVAVQLDVFGPTDETASRLDVRGDSCEIIDGIKTSTWRKFLTELRPSEGGLLRPTGAPMFRAELTKVRSTLAPSSDQTLLKVMRLMDHRVVFFLTNVSRLSFSLCVFMSTKMPWTSSRRFLPLGNRIREENRLIPKSRSSSESRYSRSRSSSTTSLSGSTIATSERAGLSSS